MRIAICGARGFIGRAIVKAATSAGVELIHLPRLDMSGINGTHHSLHLDIQRWLDTHAVERQEMHDLLQGADVAVNAAGLAGPEESDLPRLMAANAVLPGVFANLAAEALVPRLIHVSSAAVQGRMDPLDETATLRPFSPYSSSKAAGELVLSEPGVQVPGEVIVYRPTSVQGNDRTITRSLVRLASRAFLPITGRGDAPLPTCLVENVAAGVLHVAQMQSPCPRICLQPWEQMTTRLLLEAFGEEPKLVRVPAPAVRLGCGMARHLVGGSSRREAKLRRLELLAFGQAVDARALQRAGFVPAAGVEAYRRLAERVREDARAPQPPFSPTPRRPGETTT
jgi:nucleoside-diphosphate-sugar epimerase